MDNKREPTELESTITGFMLGVMVMSIVFTLISIVITALQ